jgi:hypothetical protein
MGAGRSWPTICWFYTREIGGGMIQGGVATMKHYHPKAAAVNSASSPVLYLPLYKGGLDRALPRLVAPRRGLGLFTRLNLSIPGPTALPSHSGRGKTRLSLQCNATSLADVHNRSSVYQRACFTGLRLLRRWPVESHHLWLSQAGLAAASTYHFYWSFLPRCY